MDPSPVHTRWQAPAAGEHYAHARWSSTRHAERDPRLVAGLLEKHLSADRSAAAHGKALLLDAPCGTGRLRPTLSAHGRHVGLDVSLPMLAEARQANPAGAWLRGNVTRLPFRDGSFDAVVCCRLLHHLAEPEALAEVLSELVRVSRALVIASFWDRGSLPAWRRAWLPTTRPARRHARSRAELAAAFAHAGAEVVGWKHSLRFVSRQAFVVARKDGPA